MALRLSAGWYPISMPWVGLSLVIWRSFASAIPISAVDSFASVVSRVWLTYWRVVLSLLDIVETLKPWVNSFQIVFCCCVRGMVRAWGVISVQCKLV